MARIRTIKPEFWGDEKLALEAPLTRLVFLGLVSQADDAGRLIDNVKFLDGLLFPLTDDTSREALDRLARIGRILRYSSESGQRLIQITNWAKHQKVDKPSLYTLPAPTPAQLLTVGEFYGMVAQLSEHYRDSVASESREPRAPIMDHGPTSMEHGPDHVALTSDVGATSALEKKPPTRSKNDYPPEFEAVWKVYPQRPNDNKNKAFKAWQARVRQGVPIQELHDGAVRYRAYCVATSKIKTEKTKMGQTFFGPDEEWKLPWGAPTAASTATDPNDPFNPSNWVGSTVERSA